MLTREKAREIVYKAIDQLNMMLPVNEKIDKTEGFALSGSASQLNSLGLLNFSLTIEQLFKKELNYQVILMDEKMMLAEKNPFENIGALLDYIMANNK